MAPNETAPICHVVLHLTKVAFGNPNVDHLAERLQQRAAEGPLFLTTRYLPKRHEEVAGAGSLYWIIKHQLVARSPILRFGEADGGRVAIHIDPDLIRIRALARRAHQGWRYLEHADAPPDLAGTSDGLAEMPPALVCRLVALALV